MRIVDAVEVTISEAIRRGIIDEKLHAAPIACVRELASRADAANENDNVTLPTMLKYLAALGIVEQPKPGRPPKAQAQPERSKLDSARGDRYKKFHIAG